MESVKETVKHTPGPWNVSGSHIVSVKTGVQLAEVFSPCGYDPKNQKEAANARLIAAAPDLLAALEQCLVIVDAHRRISGGDGDMAAMNARAALARAKGGAA